MNFKMIRYTLGLILLFEAAFLMVPLVTSFFYIEKEWSSTLSILGTIALCIIAGMLCSYRRPQDSTLYSKDGFVIVALGWIVLSLFGALPFVFSGSIPNYIDALFETVSGFTTTGSSIVPKVSELPNSMLMWRSFTHWVGGMGVLVFIMAILPLSGAQNMHIMRAESPGPTVSKLVPHVKKTALILYAIYFVMTVIQFVLLLFGDMTPFDALNTAFATAGTGGFGFRDDSFLSFGAYSQVIVTIFMLLFSVNFNSYYLLLNRKFRAAINSEVKVFFAIVFVAIGIITASLLITETKGAETFGDALRHTAFTVASIISTTGFATLDFNVWPTIAKVTLVALMFIGACAGSTGGGFKVSRIIILFKGMIREVGSILRPRQVKKITVDGKAVSHEVTRSVNAYLVTYVLIFAVSFFLISFDNYAITEGSKLVTNFTAVAATVNNIGPGLDMVGPTVNFSFFNPFSKLVLIFNMLAGRLELLPMLILFSPTLWTDSFKHRKEKSTDEPYTADETDAQMHD
ncbi:MAG: TrkH family potassium uptake protein [Clostridia bacterium]|nr:TrkH family potassium uptake protein [Clostridia bacterium]